MAMASIEAADGDVLLALAAPIPEDQVHTREGGFGKQLRYIRDYTVRERLNAAAGPANWSCEFDVHPNCVVCRLSIVLPSGRVVTRSGVGGYPDPNSGQQGGRGLSEEDRAKAGATDAYKRAGVMFGIGDSLYDDANPTYNSPSPGRQQVNDQFPQPKQAGQWGNPRPQQPQQQSRPPGNTPRSGKQLFGWAKENDRIGDVNSLGKKLGFAARMVDWSDSEVATVYGQLMGRPVAAGARPGHGDAYEGPPDEDDGPSF